MDPKNTNQPKKAGRDYIGVGVGALIFNASNQLLLTKRGPACRNEQGLYEVPGGEVIFGETLEDAIKREINEELNIRIELIRQLNTVNHIIPNEHWVSTSYIALIVSGTPTITEPTKCTEILWVTPQKALEYPLGLCAQKNIEAYFRTIGP